MGFSNFVILRCCLPTQGDIFCCKTSHKEKDGNANSFDIVCKIHSRFYHTQ